jgi:hypothetical protein
MQMQRRERESGSKRFFSTLTFVSEIFSEKQREVLTNLLCSTRDSVPPKLVARWKTFRLAATATAARRPPLGWKLSMPPKPTPWAPWHWAAITEWPGCEGRPAQAGGWWEEEVEEEEER